MGTEIESDSQTPSFSLTRKAHPWVKHELVVEVAEGATVGEIAEALGYADNIESTRAYLNDVEIDYAFYDLVKPKRGTDLKIYCSTTPQGGGGGDNKVLQVLVMVVMVVATIVTLGSATTGTGALAKTAFTLGSTNITYGAVLAVGIQLVGNLILAALVKPPDLGNSDGRRQISGTRNDFAPYGIVPVPLGARRQYPPLAARPYTELVGEDTYLVSVMLWGYGPVQLEDIRIGETPIENFEDVEMEHLLGVPLEDDEITLYRRDVFEDSIGSDIPGLNSGPTDHGDWIVRRTQPQTNRVVIRVDFPAGISSPGSGGPEAVELLYQVQYRKVGDVSWTDAWVNGRNIPEHIVQLNGVLPPTIIKLNPADYPGVFRWFGWRRGHEATSQPFNLPTSDTYDVRIRLRNEFITLTGNGAARANKWLSVGQGRQIWGTLTSIRKGEPIIHEPPGVTFARTAIRIRATEQLNGTLDSFNAKVTRMCLHYHGVGLNLLPNPDFEEDVAGWSATPNATVVSVTHETGSPLFGTGSLSAEKVSGSTTFMGVVEFLNDQIIWTGSSYVMSTYIKAVGSAIGMNGQVFVRYTKTGGPTETYAKNFIGLTGGTDAISMTIPGEAQAEGYTTFQMGVLLHGGSIANGAKIIIDNVAVNPVWSVVPTTNPVANIRYLLQRENSQKPAPNSRLNMASFEEAATFCRVHGYEYSFTLTEDRSVYEMCNDIGSTCRMFLLDTGQLELVIDQPTDEISQAFSIRNCINFSSQKTFKELPNALRVIYDDENQGSVNPEVIVYNRGFNATNTVTYEQLRLPGVLSEVQADAIGRYFMKVGALRPERYKFRTGVEHLKIKPGKRIEVTHPVPLWGTGASRIKTVNTSGPNITGFVLDAPVTMESGKSYACEIRSQSLTLRGEDIVFNLGEQDTVVLSNVIPSAEFAINAGDLFLFGERRSVTEHLVVKEIFPSVDLTAEVVCVDYNPAIFTSSKPKPFDPGVTPQPLPIIPIPPVPRLAGIVSDETVAEYGEDGSYSPRMKIKVTFREPTTNSEVRAVQWQVQVFQIDTRDNEAELYLSGHYAANSIAATLPRSWVNVGTFPVSNNSIIVSDVKENDVFLIRARSIGGAGSVSDWVGAVHEVLGKQALPPDVDAFVLQGREASICYLTTPSDFSHFEVRMRGGTTINWDSATVIAVTSDLSGETAIVDIGAVPEGAFVLMVKAVDTGGRQSENPASIVGNIGAPEFDVDVIEVNSRGDQALGWPGTKTNCAVSVGNLQADVLPASLTWVGSDEALFWSGVDAQAYWVIGRYHTMSYVMVYDPSDPELPGRFFWDVDADTYDVVRWEYKRSSETTWIQWQNGTILNNGSPHDFRVTIIGGWERGVLTKSRISQTANVITEEFEDVVTAAGGTTRLTLSEITNAITSVSLTVQSDGNGGVSAIVLDKNLIAGGPLVLVVNDTATGVTGLIDATVRGY